MLKNQISINNHKHWVIQERYGVTEKFHSPIAFLIEQREYAFVLDILPLFF